MTTLEAGAYLSLGEVAARYGVDLWKVQRLFRRRLLPTPPRVGPFRVIRTDQLPEVEAALVRAGYLAPPASEQIDPSTQPVEVRVQINRGHLQRAVSEQVTDGVEGNVLLHQPAGEAVA